MKIDRSLDDMAVYTGLDREDCIELYLDFFDALPEIKNNLYLYGNGEDYISLFKEAHKLSGLLANLFLKEAGDIALILEASARRSIECKEIVAILVRKCYSLLEEFLSLQ